MQQISWWKTKLGDNEIQNVIQSISQENISQGSVTSEFERQIGLILGVPYVVATTSGSMAILMALIAAGVGPGDEVIVPNRTWIATAHAPLLLGAKVVLVDVEKDCPLMDVSQLESKITNRTKAIIPVHLNGRAVDMDDVNRIGVKYGIRVIEDAAQALCSKNSHGFLGLQSFAGCFSLSVAKIITTGQGGFVVTHDEETYKALKLIRTHGVNDVVHCSYTRSGFNFRFTDIQASIGIAQLKRLPDRIQKVKAIYERYAAEISRLTFLRFLPVNISAGEIPIYVEVLCSARESMIKFLSENDIQVRPFYPDLNDAKYLNSSGRFLNSENFGQQGVFLPCGPDQPLENIDRTLEILHKFQQTIC